MITSVPLAIFFMLAALFSAVELMRSRRAPEVESYIADREAQATHVLMNGGMAAMFAPFYGSAIERGIGIAFGIAIAVLTVRLFLLLIRKSEAITNRVAGSVYHALGLAAMIYAIHLMPADMAGMRDMTGMTMAPVAGASAWLAMLLGAIFLLDGIATAALVGFFPKALIRMERAIDGEASLLRVRDQRTMRAIRIAAVPHCIMDLGMVLMLLG